MVAWTLIFSQRCRNHFADIGQENGQPCTLNSAKCCYTYQWLQIDQQATSICPTNLPNSQLCHQPFRSPLVMPGVNLPNTLIFDYPTISAIADFTTSQMGPTAAPVPSLQRQSAGVPPGSHGSVVTASSNEGFKESFRCGMKGWLCCWI